MANLGERIKELRNDKNLTMKQLANSMNVSEVAVSYWENNKRTPNLETIKILAKFFDVTIGYLVGVED